MFQRSSGVVLHISSLPSPYGIGTMGKDAYQFVDFLRDGGQTYWQVLPLGQTGFGDSPYQCFSAAAGNPYFIDLDMLADMGLRDEQDLRDADVETTPDAVDFAALRAYRIVDAVKSVSCGEIETYGPEAENASHLIALYDFGAKRGIIKDLVSRGCTVKAVPYHTTAESILADAPDGVMLSNGPGDPADNGAAIAELEKMMGRLPVFGICLGHQLMALAQGGRTGKLKYGHRGCNQPVRDTATGKCYITSQNHGYAVLSDALPADGRVSFTNVNDGTCEGLDYPTLQAFSVQFHPEARPGPEDTSFLFDRFLDLMQENR